MKAELKFDSQHGDTQGTYVKTRADVTKQVVGGTYKQTCTLTP